MSREAWGDEGDSGPEGYVSEETYDELLEETLEWRKATSKAYILLRVLCRDMPLLKGLSFVEEGMSDIAGCINDQTPVGANGVPEETPEFPFINKAARLARDLDTL